MLVFAKSTAQNCSGSLGDPIVNITFGSGPNFGPPLSSNTTSALQYQAATCPSDGFYSIVNYTSGCWPNDVLWHTATDHTGNSNGYYMLINASNQPSNFYIQTIDGLCAGTTYQFAAWLLNMCSITGTLPNVTFTIEKTDGTVLATYNTNDIPIINPVTWVQYGFYFTTPGGVSSVVLRMRNNSPGGVGNDLGLDDITFRPAGPAITAAIAGNAGATINQCVGDTSIFHFVSTVENCYASSAYQWQSSIDSGNSWNDITGANSTTYTRLPTVAGTYLYRLLVAESINIGITNCRVPSNIITINVKPRPQTIISYNGPVCSGEALSVIASGNGLYTWSGPGGFTANGNTITITQATTADSGKYYVTTASTGGCTTTDSISVDVYASPVALFSITSIACEKQVISFIDQSLSPGDNLQKWSWDFGDGNKDSITSPVHVFDSAAGYGVSLRVQNSKGCKNSITKEVVINPLPKPDFLLPAICLADPFATFINTSSINSNNQQQLSYSWNFGDANATPLNPNTSFQQSPKHSYISVGVYPVQLTVTSAAGCAKDTVKNFTVNGSLPVADFIIDTAQNFCSNNDIILTDNSSVNFGSITKREIYWDFINEPSVKIIDSLPFATKIYKHRYDNFNTPSTKTVTIKYIVYSGINCVDETLQKITLKIAPVIQFTSLNNICDNVTPFLLTQGSEVNGLDGTGIYSGAGVSETGLFNPFSATAGTHIIRYTFTANNNCSAFAEQSVTIFMQPKINAGPDRNILSGGYILLDATATGNNLQYSWQPDIAIENNHVLTPKISPLQNIIYTLTVVDADGCTAKDDVSVTVFKNVFVPAAFSPNGDGINDVWRIPYIDSYVGATVQVFNRYGETVYFSKGKTVAWNGTFKGQPLPTGSYAWVLDTGDGKKVLHGMVTIVR